MAYHNELGRWGEDVAASYLRQLGYTILHRDWDYRHRDLDIVAVDNGVLVIAEVKTRKDEQFADADEAVTPQKVRSLSLAANAYVKRYGINSEIYQRTDRFISPDISPSVIVKLSYCFDFGRKKLDRNVDEPQKTISTGYLRPKD